MFIDIKSKLYENVSYLLDSTSKNFINVDCIENLMFLTFDTQNIMPETKFDPMLVYDNVLQF